MKIYRYKLPKRAKTLYIHTLNNQPAIYDIGGQICYAGINQAIPLCTSLKQIEQEQKLSRAWRNDFSQTSSKVAEYVKAADIKYGYLKLKIP